MAIVSSAGVALHRLAAARPAPSRGGRRHRYTIGPVGEINLEDAREKARELRSLIRQGRDPVAEKKAQRNPKAAPALFGDVVELSDRRFLSKKRSGRDNEPLRPRARRRPSAENALGSLQFEECALNRRPDGWFGPSVDTAYRCTGCRPRPVVCLIVGPVPACPEGRFS
jgi:hypothetical protein